MQSFPCLGLAFALLLGVVPAAAQDDVPWWRQLFGQSAANETAPVAPPAISEEGAGAPLPVEEGVDEGTSEEAPMELFAQGSVHFDVPWSILQLDTLKADPEEIRIPGFRVQLFMGRLDTARALRLQLLEEEGMSFDVHLAPYPPLFGVQVGDFRTSLSAYRARRGLLKRYPDALVVPAELMPEKAFPYSGGCIRTP